jgi:hypothetical protein
MITNGKRINTWGIPITRQPKEVIINNSYRMIVTAVNLASGFNVHGYFIGSTPAMDTVVTTIDIVY